MSDFDPTLGFNMLLVLGFEHVLPFIVNDKYIVPASAIHFGSIMRSWELSILTVSLLAETEPKEIKAKQMKPIRMINRTSMMTI
jgi:hypothetical protein